MRKLLVFCLVLMSTSLAACTASPSASDAIQTARDMKLLLDERQIDCEAFDVFSTGADSEVLTCLDGTASQKSFRFLVWKSIDLRDADLEDFCFELNRQGNAATELIVQDTWLAYSESDFFPATAFADELDASIVSGLDFCTSRSLEVAPAYSDLEITECDPGVLSVRGFVGNENYETKVNTNVGDELFLWYEIRNEGPVDCVLGREYGQPVFKISTGPNQIWDSSDCTSNWAQQPEKILQSKENWVSAPRRWELNYSSSTGCEPTGNTTLSGGGIQLELRIELKELFDEKLFYLF